MKDEKVKKGVIYTCITGGYDTLINHTFMDHRWDYICFTDDLSISNVENSSWQIKPLLFDKLDNVRNQRWHKLHPHILFPEYKKSIWIDGNINILNNDIFDDIDKAIDKSRVISVAPHPLRNCVYDELIVCAELGKDDETVMRKQEILMRSHGFPEKKGLFENNVMYRDHHEDIVIKIMKDWWWWIVNYSRRDQLSLSYVLWQNKLEVMPLTAISYRYKAGIEFIHNTNHVTKDELLVQRAELIDQRDEFRQVLAARDEQIDALYHSTSWRMTRPLRLIGQALKRFRHMGLRRRLACFWGMTYRPNGEPKRSQVKGEELKTPDMSTGNPLILEEALSKTLAEILEVIQSRIVKDSTYFGIPCQRSPLDFWIYQETIFALKPDVIVEIGSYCGGSALSLAHLCDHLDKGRVIAVDIDHSRLHQTAKKHPRISFVTGDACEVFDEVAAMCCGAAVVMVIEDSSHEFQNTLNVLKKYSQLVTVESYLIVEDSICHHGLNTGPKPGPYEAISEFLSDYQNFHIDRKKEAFLMTWNPKGYLIRKK